MAGTMSKDWDALNNKVVRCKKCPRLIEHCKKTAREKRKSYQSDKYWGKPVPNFGPAGAEFLIVGLAPAAHGANRTGRMFTGDRSGDWLYRALYKAGFANQAEATWSGDGLELQNTVITAVAHCAPPLNKPTREEIANCENYLTSTFELLPVKVILALGGIAWKATLDYALAQGMWKGTRPKFGHEEAVELRSGQTLIGSYHPSQQNTFTGRLTEPMFDRVFQKVRAVLES